MRYSFLLLSLWVNQSIGGDIAAPVYPPAEIPGALVIVGGGGMPESVRSEFIKLAGGAEKAKIIVIPTASAAADQANETAGFLKPWTDAGVKSVTLLHTRDRDVANSVDFCKPLADATGVWFSGGSQQKITDAYLDTKTAAAFQAVLKRGGVVGGTSAGAAIMSDLMITGGKDKPRLSAGLGFLPGIIIDQHLSERNRLPRLQAAIQDHASYAGVGIDESTAIVLRGGRVMRILGEGGVTVCLAKSSMKEALIEKYSARQAIDLFQLRRAAHFRALAEPFPSAKAATPNVPKGSLLIVGGGGAGPEIWKKFIELAGGPEKTMVVISTANEDPVPADPIEAKLLRRYGAKDVQVLHTRDRQKADSPEFSKVLTNAGGVWFSGGRQWRFVDSYENTLTEKRFREVLERGGVIGGSSAGASIQSEYMPRGHPLGNTVMAAEGYERGFGFLPGCAVDQHFFARKRTADMTGLMKMYPQILGIGIDEGTAIVVQGSIAQVIGRTKVGFYDYTKKQPAKDEDFVSVPTGGQYDLAKRKVIEEQ